MNLFDGIEVDRDILEQANPIFNTAKMTPYAKSLRKLASATCSLSTSFRTHPYACR
ncbi:MAG: hypothetical protein Q4B54_08640 [Coriobacteriales bacterium]|nr:hypothetical protein [Coriobacteriales bacterium]